MNMKAISRLYHMCKKEKELKGLQFSDRSNDIMSDRISTRVSELDVEELINPSTQSETLIQEPNDEAIIADAIDKSIDGIVDADATIEDNEGRNNSGSYTSMENMLDKIMPEESLNDRDEDAR